MYGIRLTLRLHYKNPSSLRWSLFYPGKLISVKKYRNSLLDNSTPFLKSDFGAGSRRPGPATIAAKARQISVNPVFGLLLYRVVARNKPHTIIELGTAFGVSTMYLSSGNPDARVITVEANPQLATMASIAFETYNYGNITVLNKTFEDSLPELSPLISAGTLVFIDGNHTFEATMKYFSFFSEAGILVFDDIVWSDGMKKAWRAIRRSPRCRKSIDLFRMGVVYLDY
jgi:predicted O-methyltransferase YrrM